ncbi:MAG TPA: Hsp20/alpha crystallin family protein [Candidatus Baltobacteraceae bacterium]|jgi:HSP20 family protein|nr:Hsp20/alpha crystallin family protein [Candidatus Baltobacteraceae bacterium]
MSNTKWQRPDFWAFSPVRRITSLRDEVDNLFNLAFGRLTGFSAEPERASQFLEGWFPAVDVYEDKDNLLVRAELPGMKKEDIEISLHEGALTLSGERKGQELQEGAETYRSERRLGRFHRTISLPCSVVGDKIKATYTDGILTVSLPKAEEAKPKQIPVTVN